MGCCKVVLNQLNKKIVIERATKTRIVGGGYDYEWNTLKIIYGSIKPKNGREGIHANQLEATNMNTVIFRYFDGLLPDDRLNHNGKLYQIRSIVNMDEMNQWYELVAELGVVT